MPGDRDRPFVFMEDSKMVLLYKYKTENPVESGKKQRPGKFQDEQGREISRGMRYLKDALSRSFPDEPIEVHKDENEKPHADRSDVKVSVTHAGSLVICAVSDAEIGIDFEEKRANLKPMKIAGRYFTEAEKIMIEECGEDAFYEIWCRKEAFMKYEGSGISYGFKNIQTAEIIADESGNEHAEFLEKIEGVPVSGMWIDGGYFACVGGQGETTWIEVQE